MDLLKEFKRTDINNNNNNNNELNREEFLNCLKNFGFKLKYDIENELIDLLCIKNNEHSDKNNRENRKNQYINYNDFILAVKCENINGKENENDNMGGLKRRINMNVKHGLNLEKVL